MNELELLLKLSAQAQMYVSDKIRTIKLQELEAKAHFYGYSFDHFTSFGKWRTYKELETIKPSEPVETRVFASIKLIPCKYCGNEFKEKGNKIFCCEGCRHKYHNESKLNNNLLGGVIKPENQ